MTDLKRLYQSDLPNRAIAVYLYLRGRANREGVCWPAVPTMARELKMSESTVRRGVRVLAPGDRDHILSGVFNQFLSALTEPVE